MALSSALLDALIWARRSSSSTEHGPVSTGGAVVPLTLVLAVTVAKWCGETIVGSWKIFGEKVGLEGGRTALHCNKGHLAHHRGKPRRARAPWQAREQHCGGDVLTRFFHNARLFYGGATGQSSGLAPSRLGDWSLMRRGPMGPHGISASISRRRGHIGISTVKCSERAVEIRQSPWDVRVAPLSWPLMQAQRSSRYLPVSTVGSPLRIG